MITRKAATIVLAVIALVVGLSLTAHAQGATPSKAMAPGAVVWYDLLTEDVGAVLDFYRDLFGWELVQHNANHYVVVHKGRPMAGISQIRDDDLDVSEAFWLAGIVVDDVDKAVGRASKNGATVHIEPKDSKNYARYAVISDPEGVPVMLLDPFQQLGSGRGPGAWVWTELWARDPDAAAKFYKKVVGFERGQVEVGGAPYEVFKTADELRAGLVKTPNPKVDPAWAPYLLVDDLEDTLARTPRLGGRVLVKPTDFRSGGSVALLADPSGAAFFVYQPNETEE